MWGTEIGLRLKKKSAAEVEVSGLMVGIWAELLEIQNNFKSLPIKRLGLLLALAEQPPNSTWTEYVAFSWDLARRSFVASPE